MLIWSQLVFNDVGAVLSSSRLGNITFSQSFLPQAVTVKNIHSKVHEMLRAQRGFQWQDDNVRCLD